MIALNDRTRLTVLPISDKFSAERKKEQMKSALFFYVFFYPLGVSSYTFGVNKTHSASQFIGFSNRFYTPSLIKSSLYNKISAKIK